MRHGKPVNIQRLAKGATGFPSSEEWELLDQAEAIIGVNIVNEPKYEKSKLFPVLLGDAQGSIPYKERSPELQRKCTLWYARINWWENLKRIGFKPNFSDQIQPKKTPKRQKISERNGFEV